MSGMTTAELAPDAQTLTLIVGDVFAGLVGEPVGEQICVLDPATEVLPMNAFVSVTGEWCASVVFACSETLARNVAGRLFGIAPGDVDAADLRDVIGELVNVIGGNVKSVMPGPSVLSLPQASLGEAAPAVPADIETAVHLAWAGEPMRVSVCTDVRTADAPSTPTKEEQ